MQPRLREKGRVRELIPFALPVTNQTHRILADASGVYLRGAEFTRLPEKRHKELDEVHDAVVLGEGDLRKRRGGDVKDGGHLDLSLYITGVFFFCVWHF